jgi:hypothetical protein
MAAEQPERVPTLCNGCGAINTRGKHHVAIGTAMDPQTGDAVMVIASLHFSCCLERGCPDGTCTEALAAEEARLAIS